MNALTFNAISTMKGQISGNSQKFIVEVSKVKVMENAMKMIIFDGANTSRAIIFMTEPRLDILKVCKSFGEEGQPKYLIQIVEFTTYEDKDQVCIQILNFKPLEPQKSRSDSTISIKKEVKFEQRGIKTEKKQTEKSKPIQMIKSEDRTQKFEDKSQQMEVEEQAIDENELRNFDKISDLYVDIPGWEIVVRVLQKSYRQFNNRAGKLTKIFSMVLVDRTGMKIQGIMFGDSAKEYHELIKTNGVYRMSRGQIREENYNQNRGEKFSKYNIMFNRGSIFIPIADIPIIPRPTDTNVELKDLLSGEWNMERQFDIAGILLDIGQERNFEKDGRNIFKKQLLIGDPETMKAIEVVIWNKDMFIDERWLNRTIQLKTFKLSTYKDTISLNSIFKSQIKLLPSHRFNNYQGKYSEKDYQNVTAGKDSIDNGNNGNQKLAKTIKDLQQQINFMNSNDVVFSDLEVWLSHVSFKGRWFYEACNNPKCKKSAEPFSKCLHCGHYNDNTHRKFILPIELSDITGSLWTTAFDQFAQEIFKGEQIENLYRLEEVQLREEAEKRLFQQYKLKLSSKKQAEGNVKHSIVGKGSEINIQKAAMSNVERIKKILFD